MSNLFAILLVGVILAIPVLLVILVIRALRKKPIKKLGISVLICVGAIIPLTILGVSTDPATWCEHDREVISETQSTCTEKGKIVEHCDICNVDVTKYKDKLPHNYQLLETIEATCQSKGKIIYRCSTCNGEEIEKTPKVAHVYQVSETIEAKCTEPGHIVEKCVMCSSTQKTNINAIGHSLETNSIVNATCTSGGYTIEKCTMCSATQNTNKTNALGHSVKEISRTEPTYDANGEIVKKCERCDHKEVETISKLEPITIKFDGLELVFGQYSFVEVDNKFSDYYGKTVVKIPVTIKNLSKDPHSLNYFYYKLFGTSGVESPQLYVYFSDDVAQSGDLLPGSSYVAYFYILYDGDGTYTIVFDNWLFDEKTVQIQVKK